jgi:hypothetical protein
MRRVKQLTNTKERSTERFANVPQLAARLSIRGQHLEYRELGGIGLPIRLLQRSVEAEQLRDSYANTSKGERGSEPRQEGTLCAESAWPLIDHAHEKV